MSVSFPAFFESAYERDKFRNVEEKEKGNKRLFSSVDEWREQIRWMTSDLVSTFQSAKTPNEIFSSSSPDRVRVGMILESTFKRDWHWSCHD